MRAVTVGTHRNLMSSLPLLLLPLFLAFVSATPPNNPQPVDSFNLRYIQFKNVENCSYTVAITTSCSSPNFTGDQISIAFGDAYGNQVYAQRLDDLFSGTFTKCSLDTFQLKGPCAYKICYAYLYRDGPDGWKPETVQIWSATANATFYYDVYIPDVTWYGYNACEWPSTSPPSAPPPSYSTPPPPPPSYIPPPPPFYYTSPPPPPSYIPPPPPVYSSPPPPPPSYIPPPPPVSSSPPPPAPSYIPPPPPFYSSPPPPPPSYIPPPPPFYSTPPPPPFYIPPPPPSAGHLQAVAWWWFGCLIFGVLADAIL